jgi:hypothetical protein
MAGRGRGGGGRGRGWRNIFFATGLTGWQREMAAEPAAPVPSAAAAESTVEQELAALQAQANATATALEEIRQRIDEIAAAKSQEAAE